MAFAGDDSYWEGDALDQAAQALDKHPSTALLAARVLVGPTARLDPHRRRVPPHLEGALRRLEIGQATVG